MNPIPSIPAIEVGHGLLFVENDHALFTTFAWPQTALETLSRSKAFELHAERDGTAVLHSLPASERDHMQIVLTPECLQGASLLNPETKLTRLSFLAANNDGQRPLGEFPVRLQRDEVRFAASDLSEALRLLQPETPMPTQLDGESLRTIYPFLPAGAQYRVRDGEIAIEYPPLTAAQKKEVSQLFHWGKHAIRTRNLASTVRDLGRVLDLDPTYLKAREDFAVAQALTGNIESGRVELHRLLLLSPHNARAWRRLATINLGRNPTQSETYLQRAAVLEAARNGSSTAPVHALAGMYEFSRAEVEALDFRHFLSLYSRDRLPSGPRLAALMGAVTLVVGGYDDDPREVWEIPEVRRFYQALLKAWPYAPYFCDLGNGNLAAMFQSCLNSIMTRRVDGHDKARVMYDPHELVQLLRDTLQACQELWPQTGLTVPVISDRTKAVFEYFIRS